MQKDSSHNYACLLAVWTNWPVKE